MEPYGPLDNYLIALRNQRGLSQRHVALLLDCQQNTVRDFEYDVRLPDLKQAIALELILDEPLQAIVPNVSATMRALVASRASALGRATKEKSFPGNAQLLRTLADLAHLENLSVESWEDIR